MSLLDFAHVLLIVLVLGVGELTLTRVPPRVAAWIFGIGTALLAVLVLVFWFEPRPSAHCEFLVWGCTP